MRYILFALVFIIQFSSVAQKELKGEWDLQFMGTTQEPRFDINDPTLLMQLPGQSGMSVNFDTKDDSLNKDMNQSTYDFFKNCWLKIVNKKKFIRNDLTIGNGVIMNEESNGKYTVNAEKQEIEFEEIYSSKKSRKFLYTYKIEGDILTLTSVDNPEFYSKYKRRL